MAILKNRPLFSACLFYIICTFCARFALPGIKIGICCAALFLIALCTLLFLLRRLPKRVFLFVSALLLCAFVSFAVSYLTFQVSQQEYREIAQKQSCELDATVTERKASDTLTVYRVRVHQTDKDNHSFDAQLICEFPSYLQVGDRFTATVQPETFDQLESELYHKNAALADGLRMQFTCEQDGDIHSTKEGALLPMIALHRLNHTLCRILLDVCQEESGSLICALLLGNKSFLLDTVNRDFSRAGASHMLALSGMHVSILIGAVGWLLSRLHMHKKLRAVFLVLVSLFYLLLTGVSVSATRAVLMVCVLQLSYLLAADHDTLTTLSLVGVGILLFDPYSCCDAGFILSFLATFGIVVLVPPLHTYLQKRTEALSKPPNMARKKRFWGITFAIIETLLIGVIACFSILVPSCFLIGNMSVFSALTTLLLSPLISVLLVLGAVLLFVSPIGPLAKFFATLIRLLCSLMSIYLQKVSQTDGALIPLTHPVVRVLAILFCCLMLVLLILPLRKKVFLALPPVLLSVCLCIFFPVNALLQQSTLRASYQHPSSVSESLVSANGYRAYICDLSRGSSNAMQYATYAAAQLHATEIGAILLTDYSTTHVSSLPELFASYKTDLIYMPVTTDPDAIQMQTRLCEIAQAHSVQIMLYEYGKAVSWYDDATVTVHRTDLDRSEQPVLVVTLQRGDACMTMLCASARHSPIADAATQAISSADVTVCMERGPKTRLPYTLPVADGAEVVFATRELASYCDPASLSQTGRMTVCPKIAYFTLETEQEP